MQTPGSCTPPPPTPTTRRTPRPHRVEPISAQINLLLIAATPGPIPRGRSNRSLRASASLASSNSPVLINDDGQIVAGHGRVEAAKLLGLAAVPTLRLSHLSPAEQRAYVLADNKLAENAGWDRELLAIELQGLIDLDFEVELTGFEIPRSTLSLKMPMRRRVKRTAHKTAFPTLYLMRVSPSPATCGSWVNIASSAAMLSMSRTMLTS